MTWASRASPGSLIRRRRREPQETAALLASNFDLSDRVLDEHFAGVPERVRDLWRLQADAGLESAARRYDPTRGMSFRRFAQWVVRGRLAKAKQQQWLARRSLGSLADWRSPVDHRTPLWWLIHTEEALRLRAALRKMPELKAQALYGGTLSEIAALRGCTPQTVSRRLRRQRAAVARRLTCRA